MKTIWEIALKTDKTPSRCHGCNVKLADNDAVIQKKPEIEGGPFAFCDLECFLENNGVWLVESGHSHENWQSVDSVHSSESEAVAHATELAKSWGYAKQPDRPDASYWCDRDSKGREGKGPKWISVNQREVDKP